MGIRSIVVLAIDPGKTGGICRYDTAAPAKANTTFYQMPLDLNNDWDPWAMAMMVWSWKLNGVERVIIEQCHAFPGKQAFASSVVMEAYGMWQGVLACQFTKDQVVVAPANKWKKDMDLLVPVVKAGKKATEKEKSLAYKARKAKALEAARKEFYPPFKTLRGRDLDGEAEAALLALWGSRL